MPDHRQNHGEQVMQHILVLAPETIKNGGKINFSSVCMLGHKHHQFLGFSGVGRKKN